MIDLKKIYGPVVKKRSFDKIPIAIGVYCKIGKSGGGLISTITGL